MQLVAKKARLVRLRERDHKVIKIISTHTEIPMIELISHVIADLEARFPELDHMFPPSSQNDI